MARDTWQGPWANTSASLFASNTTTSQTWHAPYNSLFAGDVTTANESRWQAEVKAGTYDKLMFNIRVTSASYVTTAWGRLNGTDQALTCSQTAGATGIFEDTTHSFSVADADLLVIKAQGNINGGSSTASVCLMHYSATSAETVIWGCNSSTSLLTTAATTTQFYQAIGGAANSTPQSTESTVQQKVRAEATISRMRTDVTANSKSTAGSSYVFRNNAATGNQVTSYAASATGIVVDTTHSDTVAVADLPASGLVVTVSGSIATAYINYIAVSATSHAVDYTTWGTAANSSSTADTFGGLWGRQNALATTESQVQATIRFSTKFSFFRLNVRTAVASASITGTFRQNTANGNQTVTANAAGQFEDTTHADTTASGDLVNMRLAQATSALWAVEPAITSGSPVNNVSISQTLGPLSHSLNVHVDNPGGISQTFGLFSQAIVIDDEPKEHGTISQTFGGIQHFVNVTEAGTRGTGIRRFWTF